MGDMDDPRCAVRGPGGTTVHYSGRKPLYRQPAWMNCYQHPDTDHPLCALHLERPTMQHVQGWGDTVVGIPDGPAWVCPVGVGGSLGSSVSGRDQSIPMVVFGQPPADDTEQAAFLLGGTHAVLTLRAAGVLATIGQLGTDLG